MEVLITVKGLELLAELDPKVEQYENNFAKNLTEKELEQFNNLLEKFRTI